MSTASAVKQREWSSSRINMLRLVLIILVIISALAVVYVADLNRRLFIAYQDAQSQHNQLYVEWGRLLLEQSTWSTQERVQTLAEQRLGMHLPQAADVVSVQP